MTSAALDRRQVVFAAGSLGLLITGSGCATLQEPLSAICVNDPDISSKSTPLTIDVHSHVFNGSDLQIRSFLTDIIARDNKAVAKLAPILQELAWGHAPTGRTELVELEKVVAPALRSCGKSKDSAFAARGEAQAIFVSQRQAGYEKAINELKAAQSLVAQRTRSPQSLVVANQAINSLPKTYEAFQERRRKGFLRDSSYDVDGVIDFVIHHFQYRYVNAIDYIRTFSGPSDRKVDLMITSLVDYDYPIGGGRPTPTSLAEQVAVMEKITVLTGGRVHSFVAFDPMKQVVDGSALRVVQDAVENRGCIGVKIYPPMGFAPFGNALRPASFWDRSWLPIAIRQDPLFGLKLDGAMAELYTWCLARDVPILTHTSRSNGPSTEFEDLVSSSNWKLAFQKFPGLRVCFAHFGNSSLLKYSKNSDALEYASLMTKEDDSSGRNVYADSSYFTEILSRPIDLGRILGELFAGTAEKGQASVANRLMYGTDWEMILIEGPDASKYLRNFESVFTESSSLKSATNRFFGQNAVKYLGLTKGNPTRSRLDAFYARNNVSAPDWLLKVDA